MPKQLDAERRSGVKEGNAVPVHTFVHTDIGLHNLVQPRRRDGWGNGLPRAKVRQTSVNKGFAVYDKL